MKECILGKEVEDAFALKQMEKQLTGYIIGFLEPPSTRWHRNYNDKAWWYFIWQMNDGELP